MVPAVVVLCMAFRDKLLSYSWTWLTWSISIRYSKSGSPGWLSSHAKSNSVLLGHLCCGVYFSSQLKQSLLALRIFISLNEILLMGVVGGGKGPVLGKGVLAVGGAGSCGSIGLVVIMIEVEGL